MTARGGSTRLHHLSIVSILLVGMAVTSPARAQSPELQTPFLDKARLNELNRARVGIVTGLRVGTYAQMGEQLAQVLGGNARQPFRVVVTLGRGSLRNLSDLINMPGIDLALVQSDVMEAYRNDAETYKQLRNRIRIVATLHEEAVHVLASGNRLDRLEALEGKRVNIDVSGSGSNLTARTLFGRLGIHPDFDEAPASLAKARLIAGSLDALVFVASKRNDLFSTISFAEADRAALHFLPIPVNGTGAEGYVPAQITHADYPDLVNADRPVDTRAARAVLAIIAWKPTDDRYAAAARFVDLFFSLAPQLVQPNTGFSQAWCQADLGGVIPGWERFDAADKWLAQHPGAARKLAQAPGSACQ